MNVEEGTGMCVSLVGELNWRFHFVQMFEKERKRYSTVSIELVYVCVCLYVYVYACKCVRVNNKQLIKKVKRQRTK